MAVVLNVVTEASTPLTGTLTFGSTVVTGLASTAALVLGQVVRGTGLPSRTLILSIDSATQVTLTATAQATGATALSFMLEPVTLQDAKDQLRILIPNDNVLISRKISSARRMCETYTKRAFLPTTFDAMWDAFPFGGGYFDRSLRQAFSSYPGGTFPGFLPTNTGNIEFPRAQLLSLTSITYYDSNGALQTLDPTVYNVETGVPGRLAPAYGHIWPTTLSRLGAVTIRFVAGYPGGIVPESVQEAILLLTTHLYENRGDENSEMPSAVARLLSTEDWGGYS